MTALAIRGGHLVDPAAGVDAPEGHSVQGRPRGGDCRAGQAEAGQRRRRRSMRRAWWLRRA